MISEKIRSIFYPDSENEQKELEAINAAYEEEEIATGKYLRGEMSLDEYVEVMEKLTPLTAIDLRALAKSAKRK